MGRFCRFEGCKETASYKCRKCFGAFCGKHKSDHQMNCRFK